MRTSKKLTITLVFSVFIILIAGAYSATGKPSQPTECAPCHTLDPVLMTISSNATGTVNAKVGTPFSLVINAASLDTNVVAPNMAVKVYSGWADNSQFSFADPLLVIDNGAGDSNANDAQISTTFSFTPLTVGSWILRIWTAAAKGDAGKITQKLDVTVSVTLSDSTPPTINSPIDMIIDEGDITKNITWNPADANPQSFEIFDDSVSWQSGSWDGSPIVAMLNTLTLGTHNITLAVWDAAGNTASDEVNVTVVDGTLPVIDSPANVTYNEGSTGHSITWNPTDSHPSSYAIYRDSVLVKSGTWNSSIETILISIDSLQLGEYNYTLLVSDVGSNTAIDTVWVKVVDGTPPIVDNPADISYPEGDSGYSITWSPSDLHPMNYTIYLDGTPIKSGLWNSSSETMMIPVDGHFIGVYNYTIALVDFGGNIAVDQVTVTVFSPDLPTINHPSDQDISEGSVGLEIIWDPLDLNPSSYAIYQNEILVKSGLWNSSAETISISLDGLALGVHNFTAIVIDQDSNIATDTVWITVSDGTAPVLDSPSDVTYDEGETSSSIVWNPSDLHPVNYAIYLDGTPIKSGLWNSSSEFISILVDGHLVGEYNYTIVVGDIGGNVGIDTVLVFVLDATAPTIDNPIDINYNEGEVAGSIFWNPSDSYPAGYEIYRNNALLKSGLWNSSAETIIVSVTGLSVGTYNFTIIVYDVGANSVSDLVWVNVTDGTSPIIDSPADVVYFEGDTGNSITWNPSDLHPVSYEIFRNGVLIKSGMWNSSSESIVVSVDGLALGVHNYTLVVIDIGNNSALDQVDVVVQVSTSSTTTTTNTQPTQTTTPGNPNVPQIPVEPILMILVTWIGVGVLAFVIADFLVRRHRG